MAKRIGNFLIELAVLAFVLGIPLVICLTIGTRGW